MAHRRQRRGSSVSPHHRPFAIRHIHLDLTNPYRYTEELCGLIQQAEYTADGTWLYVTDAGSLSSDLLKLRCPADMDTSTLQIGWRYVNSILSHPQYHMAYDRRTNEITWCDELPEYLTVTAIGGFGSSPAQPMESHFSALRRPSQRILTVTVPPTSLFPFRSSRSSGRC